MDEGRDLLDGREGARHLAPVDAAVQLEPVHRHSDRARRDSLRDELRHAGDVVVGRGFVGGAALTHHERAHRAMGDLGGDVDGAWDAVERVEVFGDGLPVPLDGLAQGRARDALDAFHETDQPVVAVSRGRGEPDAAVAHHHRGDAVPDRRGEERVPGDLAVVVRVHVDEAGCDREAGGVDLFAALIVDDADLGDACAVDRNVGDDGASAQAVDHGSLANDEIVHLRTLLPRDQEQRASEESELRSEVRV